MTNTQNKKFKIILSLVLANLIIGATAINIHKINKLEKNIDTKIENSEENIKNLINLRESQILTMIEDGYTDKQTINFLLNELNEKKANIKETEEIKKNEEEIEQIWTPSFIFEDIEKPSRYTVKKGDTLSKILFNQYGDYYLSGIKAVAKINNIKNVNNIEIGQVLEIPSLETVIEMNKNGYLNNITVSDWNNSKNTNEIIKEIPVENDQEISNKIEISTEAIEEEVSTTNETPTEKIEEIFSETDTKETPKAIETQTESVEETSAILTTPITSEVLEDIDTPTEITVYEKIEDEILPEIEPISITEYNYLMNDEDEIVNEIMEDKEFVSEMVSNYEPELEVIENDEDASIELPETDTESPYNTKDFQSSMFDDKFFNTLNWHLNLNNLIDSSDKNETEIEEFNEKKGFANEELEEYEYEYYYEDTENSNQELEETDSTSDTNENKYDSEDIIVAYGANER